MPKKQQVTQFWLDSLKYHPIPQEGGQIVQRDYAVSLCGMWERIYDRSNQDVSYLFYPFRANAAETGLRFEPWNNMLPTSVCKPREVEVIS